LKKVLANHPIVPAITPVIQQLCVLHPAHSQPLHFAMAAPKFCISRKPIEIHEYFMLIPSPVALCNIVTMITNVGINRNYHVLSNSYQAITALARTL
jgi:hypothetical protein